MINRDGFGVGWYDLDVRPEPARYRRTEPIWEDASITSIAGLLRSTAILAAARSATPGLPIEEAGNAPFTAGVWLFSHNGSVLHFLDGAGDELRSRVSPPRLAAVEGATDSEILFALTLDHLDRGVPIEDALVSVVTLVNRIAGGRLNLLATDGHRVAATAVGNSLFSLVGQKRTILASEPLDEPSAWHPVPELSVAFGEAGALTIEAL